MGKSKKELKAKKRVMKERKKMQRSEERKNAPIEKCRRSKYRRKAITE